MSSEGSLKNVRFVFVLVWVWSLTLLPGLCSAQFERDDTAGSPSRRNEQLSEGTTFLSAPVFKIPFNVRSVGVKVSAVQLWVSTDNGASWQMQGSSDPEETQFDFRAAAEGNYLFSVRTIDAQGTSFPSRSPPLRVCVDTTEPQAEMQADLNSYGQLVVDIRIADEHLLPDTAVLRMRTDQDPNWQDVGLTGFQTLSKASALQVILDLPQCREVGLALAVYDKAGNVGEAVYQYAMPRTAAGDQAMTLASNPFATPRQIRVANPEVTQRTVSRPGPELPNAISWLPSESVDSTAEKSRGPSVPRIRPGGFTNAAVPTAPRLGNFHRPRSNFPRTSNNRATASRSATAQTGRLATSNNGLMLGPSAASASPVLPEGAGVEELPLPAPFENRMQLAPEPPTRNDSQLETAAESQNAMDDLLEPSNAQGFGDPQQEAYHCRSKAFNLDYSVEALGGTTLSEVELWGTENGGSSWQQWGTDPDRQSPFDVRVGNDGLFGFRMVVVGGNGVVSNRPKSGDDADVWIRVDTRLPTAKITRAVYGEGPEEGMLVISYQCADELLVDRPIALSFSERFEGPWAMIATGLENTGRYAWRPDPNVPQQIYLRVTAVDKAGNIGEHALNAAINTRALAPRGRIQGFRPILGPPKN